MQDTLSPVRRAIDTAAVSQDPPPLVAIIGRRLRSRPTSFGWVEDLTRRNNSSPVVCHGSRFHALYEDIGVDSTLLLTAHGKGRGEFVPLHTHATPQWRRNQTYCFRQSVVAEAHTNTMSTVGQDGLAAALLSRPAMVNCTCTPAPTVRVIIVQREAHSTNGGGRVLRNLEDVVSAANEEPGVEVTVMRLEGVELHVQACKMTCGLVIIAGAQGAGLQWATLLRGTGRRAVLIEWVWRHWTPFYASDLVRAPTVQVMTRWVKNRKVWCPPAYIVKSRCCRDDCDYHHGAKHFDFNVTLHEWRADLRKALLFIRNES